MVRSNGCTIAIAEGVDLCGEVEIQLVAAFDNLRGFEHTGIANNRKVVTSGRNAGSQRAKH